MEWYVQGWLRYYATSRKVTGSIPEEVIAFFDLPNPSWRTMVISSTEPLTEMSTRNLPGGKEGPARKADNLTVNSWTFYLSLKPVCLIFWPITLSPSLFWIEICLYLFFSRIFLHSFCLSFLFFFSFFCLHPLLSCFPSLYIFISFSTPLLFLSSTYFSSGHAIE
jgi:hypothetical protein